MKKSILMTAVIAGVLALPLMATAESNSSRLNRDRAKVGRALIEVTSANWPDAMSDYADDIEYRDPVVVIQGKAMMTEFFARMFANTPDLLTIIEDESCIGGVYTATWTMYGTFNGVPYEAPGMSILKFRPGGTQAYYQRDYYTESDIMRNIPGLDAAVEGFRGYYRCAVDPTFPCPLP